VSSNGGAFVADLSVVASRAGGDKDGRTYEIRVRADNEAGSGLSDPMIVTVPHSQK
jgi:hypothetical protein